MQLGYGELTMKRLICPSEMELITLHLKWDLTVGQLDVTVSIQRFKEKGMILKLLRMIFMIFSPFKSARFCVKKHALNGFVAFVHSNYFSRLAAEHKADLRIFRTFRHIEAPGLHYNLLAKASDTHIGRQMKGNVSGAEEIANTAEKPSGQGSWHSRPASYHVVQEEGFGWLSGICSISFLSQSTSEQA